MKTGYVFALYSYNTENNNLKYYLDLNNVTESQVIDLDINYKNGEVFYSYGWIWSYPPKYTIAKKFFSYESYGVPYIIDISLDGKYALIYFPYLLSNLYSEEDESPIAFYILNLKSKQFKSLLSVNHTPQHIYKNAVVSKDGSKVLFLYYNGETNILSVMDIDGRDEKVLYEFTDPYFSAEDRHMGLFGLDWSADDTILIVSADPIKAYIMELGVEK